MKRNDFRNTATRLYCSSFYSTKLFLIEKNKQTKQTNKAKNKTKESQRVSVGSIKCIVIYLTVRNRSRPEKNTEWKRKERFRHLGPSLKKSAFGERRLHIKLPNITDHQGYAVEKAPG